LQGWGDSTLKLLLVFNSKAQSGRAKRLLPDICSAFHQHGTQVEIVIPRHPEHANELVANADLAKYDAVVAAGGDGTIFEVLNGLFSHQNRVPLGIIPIGTGNAFAREFGLGPDNWNEAITRLATANVRMVDVGKVVCDGDVFYFLNVIGIGFVTDAGIASKKLKFIGRAAYTMGTLWECLKLKSYPLRIELDGNAFEQDNIFVEISNSRFTGTSFLIAPDARIDDGLLDVTLLSKLSRWRLLRLFPTIYSGKHIDFEEVSTIQASCIRIESPAGMLMAVDGEFRGRTPVEISCMPQSLELLV
jgi:diacylglycerol kinase (ATP)